VDFHPGPLQITAVSKKTTGTGAIPLGHGGVEISFTDVPILELDWGGSGLLQSAVAMIYFRSGQQLPSTHPIGKGIGQYWSVDPTDKAIKVVVTAPNEDGELMSACPYGDK
jgi:hypothetical protein